VDYESHAIALDRNELGALLVTGGLGSSAEHALISLLALNGLRVSEATGADIEHLGLERGHRTLTITRKGGKVVTIPRAARAIDLAIGERTGGPLFVAADGLRLDRHGAARVVRRVTRRAGIAKQVARIRCGTRSSPPPSTPGCRCETCRKPPRMPTRAPPHALQPGPHKPGQARDLHRRRLRRRRRTVKAYRPGDAPPDGGSHSRAELPAAADAYYHHPAVTHRDFSANANRRSARSSDRSKCLQGKYRIG